MKCVMVTNNYKCYDKWHEVFQVDYQEDWKYRDVLIAARDYIHRGYFLLTHPMCGSVKPNQTPFRSIILADETMETADEFKDLKLIEAAISRHDQFMADKKLPHWTEKSTEDFRTIDLSLMDGAILNSIKRQS